MDNTINSDFLESFKDAIHISSEESNRILSDKEYGFVQFLIEKRLIYNKCVGSFLLNLFCKWADKNEFPYFLNDLFRFINKRSKRKGELEKISLMNEHLKSKK